jgi:hypothetical protein
VTVRELSRRERAAVIVVELHRRKQGRGPSYRFLTRELGLPEREGVGLIRRLHRLGCLTSTPEPNSLAATAEGLRRALRGPR